VVQEMRFCRQIVIHIRGGRDNKSKGLGGH
jgi:hypothetical protein